MILPIGRSSKTHLADAMRFINNKARKPVAPIEIPHDMFDGPTHTHHLWRDIHHFCMRLAFAQLLMCEILVSLGQITSICDSWDIQVAEVARLVVDERNEGRYNECDPFGLAVGAYSRQLVCIISYCPSVVGPQLTGQAFPSSSRHENEYCTSTLSLRCRAHHPVQPW